MSRYGGNDYPVTESKTPSDSHIVFGTAFPEQTERDRRQGLTDSGQFVPTWKQEVRDEKGRRRFHGAFTGGFSAGYFNTVGSKEGWTPSSFVSSRSSRTEQRASRPEDFMDEEDLQELASARKIVATDEFDVLGGTEREMAARKRQQKEDEARGSGVGFLGSSLMDMVGPTKDSVGIRLLRQLGWKPGQGIGPRRRAIEVDYVEIAGNDITFAPRDTPIVDFKAKTNTFGLGYELEKHVPQVAEMRRLRELAKQRQTMDVNDDNDDKERSAFGIQGSKRQGGFGLGVFEDDDDDVDVYGDDRRNYHDILYDIEDRPQRRSPPRASTSTREIKKQQPCSDGRPPLKGFSVSQQPQELGKWYRPPQVPADFNEQRNLKTLAVASETAIAEPKYHMSSEERGAILGEKPIEPRSVFDYIPNKSKSQLDSVLKFMTEKRPVDSKILTDFPTISKQQANMALRGFMPFGDNLKKQARYRQYLENQAGMMSEDGEPKTSVPVPEGLTHEQGMKEMDEFAKAARIFRPISAMMSGRFTSASATTTTIEQTSFEGGLKTESQWRKEKEDRDKEEAEAKKSKPAKAKSQEAEAAALKMFGQLTRTIKPFYPTRLVCKRFNVRNPHPDHDPSKASASGRTTAGSREALSEEQVDEMMRARGKPKLIEQWKDDPTLSAVIPKPSERPKESAAEATSQQSEQQQQKIEETKPEETVLDYERPSMDIFKAIFENSDDEEEAEEEQANETQEPANAESQGQPRTQHTSSQRKQQRHDDDDDDMLIGPALPPPLPPSRASTSAAAAAAAAVEAPSSSSIGNTGATTEPFRPKFNRPAERSASSSSGSFKIASERVVVEPFRPRAQTTKRRHVSVSDNEDDDNDKATSDRYKHKERSDSESDDDEEEEERSRQRRKKDKHKKRHKKSHHHKKEKKKKEKSSSSSSRKRHSRHDDSGDDDDNDEGLAQAIWVEKEPAVITSHKATTLTNNDGGTIGSSSNKRTKTERSARPRASDLW